MVSPRGDDRLAEPEWIGLRNPLGERGKPRRGQYATSADLLLAFVDVENRRHGIMLESKYTESYVGATSNRFSKRGTDRVEIYRPSWSAPWSPFVDSDDVRLEDLLIEPFDQHVRQQLLAAAMEHNGELGFRTVTVLHVAPRANQTFRETVTSAVLQSRGSTVESAWRPLLKRPERYRCCAYEDLFRHAQEQAPPELAEWVDYQRSRYGWECKNR